MTLKFSHFHYDPETKGLSQEISTLEAQGFAIGQEITIHSNRDASKSLTFRMTDVKYDKQTGEDLQYWVFEPDRKNEHITDLTIWND